MNGCYNRQPLRSTVEVQDGWIVNCLGPVVSRIPRMVTIPDPMTKTCQYHKTHDDPKCLGCKEKTNDTQES